MLALKNSWVDAVSAAESRFLKQSTEVKLNGWRPLSLTVALRTKFGRDVTHCDKATAFCLQKGNFFFVSVTEWTFLSPGHCLMLPLVAAHPPGGPTVCWLPGIYCDWCSGIETCLFNNVYAIFSNEPTYSRQTRQQFVFEPLRNQSCLLQLSHHSLLSFFSALIHLRERQQGESDSYCGSLDRCPALCVRASLWECMCVFAGVHVCVCAAEEEAASWWMGRVGLQAVKLLGETFRRRI